MTTTDPVLALEQIAVHYGTAQAVAGVSLHVSAGEVVCLLGANGAGKSSTLKAVAGVAPVSRGKVLFGGREITAEKPWAIAAAGLA
ncbi:MAG: ATP-binding cassette domain-containing protein, partial [Myxococcaceae bacterium]